MGPVAGRRGARPSRRSGRRKPLREAPSFQVHKSGHTALMLGMTMGALLAGATIIGLAWDWYRHPHLKDLNPPPRRPGRRTDAVPRRLLLARRRTPALSQVQRTRLPLGRAFGSFAARSIRPRGKPVHADSATVEESRTWSVRLPRATRTSRGQRVGDFRMVSARTKTV
jgi:hypothetical protein